MNMCACGFVYNNSSAGWGENHDCPLKKPPVSSYPAESNLEKRLSALEAEVKELKARTAPHGTPACGAGIQLRGCVLNCETTGVFYKNLWGILRTQRRGQ